MRFIKLHGYGNDYIVCEGEQFGDVSLNDFAKRVCDRHYGVGADGIAVVNQSKVVDADFEVRIFNPDGSEAAMSGNGTRAAAAYLYYEGRWTPEQVRLHTRAGTKLYTLRRRISEGSFEFKAELGQPKFDSASIPMRCEPQLAKVTNYPLTVGEETIRVTAMQMCNPNCVVFVSDFESFDWRRAGRLIESHARFPERTNVLFVSVQDKRKIDARVWERGVGETLSSGTGASAAAVAAHLNNHTERAVAVNMPGGKLQVEWRDDGEVLLTGTAHVIYRGEWSAKV